MGHILTQVKVSVKQETACAFKEACKLSNSSMASVLSQFMEQYSGICTIKGGYAPDLSKRRQRRAAVSNIMQQLERVITNEECYCSNVPENLQGSAAFENAEQSISQLSEALELLASAY